QLTGLVPLKREARYYGRSLPHLTNWRHCNAFLGAPLVARGFERAFWREMFAWADDRANGALFLHLSQMPAEGPLHDALKDILAEKHRQGATVLREERAMLRSGLDPAAYLEES